MSKTPQQVDISPEHILYVEDDDGEVYLMKTTFNRKAPQLTLDVAYSMSEALEVFDPKTHRLAITDYNLPDGEAPQLALALLAIQPNLTIISLSNTYTDDRIAAAKAAGIKKCWVKGDTVECLHRVNELLQMI